MQEVKVANYMLPDPAPLGQFLELITKLQQLGANIVKVEPFERGPENFIGITGFRQECTPVELDDKIEYALERIDKLEQRLAAAMVKIASKPAAHES